MVSSVYQVRVDELQVLITNDGDHYFAQGVEVDYAAGGESMEDVQRRFESGLRETIYANLKRFGNIARLLKGAPKEVVDEMEEPQSFELSMTCTKELEHLPQFPYNRIAYRSMRARV